MKNDPLDNISIIGAGAWGTALAGILAGAGRKVTLCARSAKLAGTINSTRKNPLYLPEITLPAGVAATTDQKKSVVEAQLVLLASPAQFLRATLQKLAPFLPATVPLINCAKGIEISSGKILSEVVRETAPGHPYAVLSGPSFAAEAALGLPTALTLATTENKETAESWAYSLRGKAFRPYLSNDPVGADVAGALKNVIAIACGIVEGRKLGQNARAAVMTRGMAEIRRFGVKKGAHPETFLGLCGIGDLTLTCHSMNSRNFSLGVEIGRGKTLEAILASRTSVAEGVATARAVAAHAEKLGVDMPICRAVDGILHHGADVGDVVSALLSRDLKNESA